MLKIFSYNQINGRYYILWPATISTLYKKSDPSGRHSYFIFLRKDGLIIKKSILEKGKTGVLSKKYGAGGLGQEFGSQIKTKTEKKILDC